MVLFVILAALTTKINGMCSLAPGQCAAADVSVIMAFKRSGALMFAFTPSLPARKSDGTETFLFFFISG